MSAIAPGPASDHTQLATHAGYAGGAGSAMPDAALEPASMREASTDVKPLSRNLPLLGVLCVAHFFNDLCLGIGSALIPAMEAKFDLSLGRVALILTTATIVGNLSQPPAGWIMDRSRTVRILLITPLISGLSFFVGLVSSAWMAVVLLMLAGLAFGAFHPYALAVAQRTLPRRPSLATAIFISFGFMGIATGSMVAGTWMEARGFANFHLLYLGGPIVIVMLAVSRIDRIKLALYRHAPAIDEHLAGEAEPAPAAAQHASMATHVDPGLGARIQVEALNRGPRIHISLLYAIGLMVAIQGGTLLFFAPKLFHELYGSEGLGGKANFLFGLFGGLSSYGYAWIADRRNPYNVAIFGQALGIVPLFMFFASPDAGGKIIAMGLIGVTMGGIYPVIAALAIEARGLTFGVRSALMLGGLWGVASIVALIMAQFPDRGIPLETTMSVVRVLPFVSLALLGYASRRYWRVA